MSEKTYVEDDKIVVTLKNVDPSKEVCMISKTKKKTYTVSKKV